MSFTGLEIIMIVSRHLHRCRTKANIDVVVSKDGQAPLDERVCHKFTNRMRIPLVFRINGNASIPQHGLRSCRGHFDLLLAPFNLVLEVSNYTKLNLLLVSRRVKHCSSF